MKTGCAEPSAKQGIAQGTGSKSLRSEPIDNTRSDSVWGVKNGASDWTFFLKIYYFKKLCV